MKTASKQNVHIGTILQRKYIARWGTSPHHEQGQVYAIQSLAGGSLGPYNMYAVEWVSGFCTSVHEDNLCDFRINSTNS